MTRSSLMQLVHPGATPAGRIGLALAGWLVVGLAAAGAGAAGAWWWMGLEVAAPSDSGSMLSLLLVGLGAIGPALAVWAITGRIVAGRMTGLSVLLEALRSVQQGRDAAEDLKLDPSYGPEAELWNRLIDEREAARRAQVQQQTQQAHQDRRRGGGGRLDELCDSLATGLVLLDDQGNVTYCNGAAAVLLGTRRDDLLGTPVSQRMDDPRLLEGLQGALDKTLRRRTTVEVDRGQQERGGVLRFTVRPARESDAARAVMIIEDITQQRVAERARYAFVAHATHELRTPLTNIRLYVESLVDEPDAAPAERGQRLNVINQEVRRLENLVGDMLSVAEIESGAMRADRDDVPMAALFESLQNDYRQQAADKSIAMHFDLPPKLPTLQGDRAKLVQALHNLVGNALKYTPEGGEVRVKAEWDNGQLVIDVADSGIGIGEQDMANLFQKFYRARDERVSKIIGSGLGLALSREIIRLHGGEITVQSQLNKGSTFTVNLPAPAQAA